MTVAAELQLQAALEGRYVIEPELANGGMARVYLARGWRHDRLVALEVLRPEIRVLDSPVDAAALVRGMALRA